MVIKSFEILPQIKFLTNTRLLFKSFLRLAFLGTHNMERPPALEMHVHVLLGLLQLEVDHNHTQ